MISINTLTNSPTTKLSKDTLNKLEDELEDEDITIDDIIRIAKLLRDNTLTHLTETELDRMIYLLEMKKGKIREIKSIIMRSIMMAIPSHNGGSRKRTKRNNRNKRSKSNKNCNIRRRTYKKHLKTK